MGFELKSIDGISFGSGNFQSYNITGFESIDEFTSPKMEEDAVRYLSDTLSSEFTLECENSWISEDFLKQFTTPLPEPYTIEYTKYVQARKHKKRRINKKWLKRYGVRPIKVKTEGWELHTYTDGSFEFVKPMGD